MIVQSGFMEQMLQKRRRRGGTWDKRTEGVMEGLVFFMEEDVEDVFGSECHMEAEMGMTLTNVNTLDSHGCSNRKELDSFAEPAELHGTKAQTEESPEGGGGSPTGHNTAAKHGETELKESSQLDDEAEEAEEEKSDEELGLCWAPGEGSHHVRISLQEVESFYRLSCRCHWICGGFLMSRHFYCNTEHLLLLL